LVRYLIIVVFFLSSVNLFADIVDIRNISKFKNISNQVGFIVDINNEMSIQELINYPDNKFIEINYNSFYRNRTENTYWLKFKIKNSADFEKKMILVSEFGIVDTALYYLIEKKTIVKKYLSGKNFSGKVTGIRYAYPFLEFSLYPSFTGEIYIKVNSCHTLYFPLNLWEKEEFLDDFSFKSFIKGFVSGSLLLFIFAGFIFYLLNPQKFFLIYLFYMIGISLVVSYYFGLIYAVFDFSYPYINHFEFLKICVGVFALFIRELFKTKDKYPIFNKFIIIIAITEVIEFIFQAFFHYLSGVFQYLYRILDLSTDISLAVFMVFILYIAYKEYQRYKKVRYIWIFISMITFSTSVFFYFMMITGKMSQVVPYYILPFTVFAEMIMMFIVFAYDYFDLNKEQNLMEIKLIKSQNEASTNLLLGQEKEQKRLAKELHDGIGSMISSLKMHFHALYSNNPSLLEDKTRPLQGKR